MMYIVAAGSLPRTDPSTAPNRVASGRLVDVRRVGYV